MGSRCDDTILKEYYRQKYKDDRKVYGKRDFPIEDRCDGFDALWNKIYQQVVWNWSEIKDITDI